MKISLAGTIYEVKRGALVQDPAIGWNRLSCVFKKRWEKFLLCDKNGRIYFDYESEWMKPILQALKGEVDIVMDKSSNNVSAWNVILSRFQLQENIKFNMHYEVSANRYFDEISWRHSKGDWRPMIFRQTPKPQAKKIQPSFHMTVPFRRTSLKSNELLQEQLSLLNQSAPIFAKMEDIFAEIQDSLILLLEELSFMQDFLYSEWKDIISSLTKMKDDTDVTRPTVASIEKHIQYFATIFPIIQDYKHRVRAASSDAERRQLDGLAYFNVEGEKMVIKKSSLLSVFGESQLAVRLSGRWTEQVNDVDEEGNIHYDVSSAAFRALLQYARFRSFRLKGALKLPTIIRGTLQGLLDYFSINDKIISTSTSYGNYCK